MKKTAQLMLSNKEIIEESIALLAELVKIQAFSGEEKAKADFLEDWLKKRDYSPFRSGNNLWLENKKQGVKTIWFHSHIDTVKPNSSWTINPFEGNWINSKLTALGCNDAGASIVAQLAAYRILSCENFGQSLIWVAGAEEENSGKGGIESILELLAPADLVIMGEPTSMQAAIAEKGLMVIDGLVKGKAGHAAREEGENAIYKALPDIQFFKNHQFEKQSDLLGPVKMNLTIIEAGEKHNSIPDSCRYTVDIRLNECYTHQELFSILQESCIADLSLRSNRLKPSATPKNHPILKAIKEMGIQTYGSPTMSDQALISYPSIKIGPGDSARSHTADEYIFKEEIEKAVLLYTELIKRAYQK